MIPFLKVSEHYVKTQYHLTLVFGISELLKLPGAAQYNVVHVSLQNCRKLSFCALGLVAANAEVQDYPTVNFLEAHHLSG